MHWVYTAAAAAHGWAHGTHDGVGFSEGRWGVSCDVLLESAQSACIRSMAVVLGSMVCRMPRLPSSTSMALQLTGSKDKVERKTQARTWSGVAM